MNATNALLLIGFCVVYLVIVKLMIDWAVRDAEARAKPGWLVALVVVFFFPVGWLCWLLLRPPISRRGPDEFDLQRYRLQ
jgi:hypothetical protein